MLEFDNYYECGRCNHHWRVLSGSGTQPGTCKQCGNREALPISTTYHRAEQPQPKTTPRVIILHESFAASVASDAWTLGMLMGLIYVNHTYGGGYWFVDALAVSWVVAKILELTSKPGKNFTKFYSVQEFEAWMRRQVKNDD